MPGADRVTAGPRVAPSREPASSRTRRLAEIGLLATALVWSFNFVVVKTAIEDLGTFTFTGARFAVAALTLLAILGYRDRSLRPPRGQVVTLAVLGILGFGLYQVLWTTGLAAVSAGDSALLIASSPVFVALLAAAAGMDRLSAPKLVGSLIAFAGVVVVIGGSQALSLGSSLAGDALTLGAALLWAVYTVGGSRVLLRIDPLAATTWTVAAGAAMLLPLAVVEVANRPATTITLPAVLAILYSGMLAAGIANVLVFHAVHLIGPTRATATQFLVPAGAVVFGALFLVEPIGLPQVLGGAIIVLGVWLTRRRAVLPGRLAARLSSAA